jgi:hypothetical protein
MKSPDPKVLDAGAGALVLALRLLWIPPASAPADWIAVLALFWIVRSLAPESPRARDAVLAGAGLWLTAIYAWNQGPLTWTGIVSP